MTAWQSVFPDWQEAQQSRNWWKVVYRAGIKADRDKQPRVPPGHYSEEQQAVWLQGYDR